MHDFPPTVDAYTPAATSRPDTRTPSAFLWWTLRQQPDVIAINVLVGLVWMLPGTLSPFLLGRVIDTGILRGDLHATLVWAGLLTLVVLFGAVGGILQHTMAVRGWLIALYGTQ